MHGSEIDNAGLAVGQLRLQGSVMASVEQNREIWDGSYDWSRGGDEWSDVWGGALPEWHVGLRPRIQRFLAMAEQGTILEIAPGFGRWTQYLKGHCQRLIVVDLAQKCIDACKTRFMADQHIEYHVTDGKSLAMVPNGAIDFVFSFDSLVHAGKDVLELYLLQLAKKLKPRGVGLIHHSNTGAYVRELKAQRMKNEHFRDETMTAALFVEYAAKAGLSVIGQEVLAWATGNAGMLSDAISLFTPRGSKWDRPNVIIQNPDFMLQARMARLMTPVYFPEAMPPAAGTGQV